MTDDQPEFEDRVAFLSSDEYGNRKRYIHLGNYERKLLGQVIRNHLISAPWNNKDEFVFWRSVQQRIEEDLDDL